MSFNSSVLSFNTGRGVRRLEIKEIGKKFLFI